MTSTSDLSRRTTIVVGASRGLGRGIAIAFAEAGAPVVAVARTAAPLAELADVSGVAPEVADAADARRGTADRKEKSRLPGAVPLSLARLLETGS